MGGLLGLEMALTRDVANLVLIAPFLRPWGRTLGLPNDWLVGRLPLYGTLAKSSAGPIKDPQAAQEHIAYHAMPAASMVSVVAAARKFRSRAAGVTCPILIHHDTHDTTSDFAESLRLVKSLGSIDKALRVYQRGKHVITLDFDRAQIESETVAWLSKRIS
jgi:esterase/lipase